MKTTLKSETRNSKFEERGGRNAGACVGAQSGDRNGRHEFHELARIGESSARPSRSRQVSTCNVQQEFAGLGAQPQQSRTPPLHGSIENTEGFWELSFRGEPAVLPQHQGLFYVAFLLGNAHGAPIPGVDLAVEVFERYGEHEDFRPPIPEYLRDHSRVAKILLRKQKRLEAVVDRDGEEDFVRLEALRELMVLDELKRIYFSEVAREAKDAGKVVWETLRELHAMLASAVDIRGEPHLLIRDFGMHLLHYVLMPSERASDREGVALFVFRPA